jgi:hypothetical protein
VLGAKERHESRVNWITPLPLFIHSSQVLRFVVEGDGISGRPRGVGDHEVYARVMFAPMPFDLGGDATRPHPSAGGMDEVRKGMANFVRRTSDRAREQVANPLL